MNKSIKTLFIKADLLKYLLVMYFNTSQKFKCNHRLLMIYLKNKFKLNKQFQLKNKYFSSQKDPKFTCFGSGRWRETIYWIQPLWEVFASNPTTNICSSLFFQGTFSFYQIHSYAFNGHFGTESPFMVIHFNINIWWCSKYPLIVIRGS